jgi:speckle-type POZ protein
MNTLDYYVSKHGSLTVHCDIVVFDEFLAEEPVTLTTFMSVPPSDLHRHLSDLLKTKEGRRCGVPRRPGDVRCALVRAGARSPVFSAELLGAMKESRTQADVGQVGDMEVPVFKVLLCFLYTDSLPEMSKEDEDAMYQHLLVAADRYDMERLS